MSYAVAVEPTWRLLTPDPYDSTGTDLTKIFDAVVESKLHYYAPVTLTHQNEVVEAAFRWLSQKWLAETRFQSSLTRITSHPAYVAIVDLGYAAVPFILRELEARPNHWFAALREITGADPVQPPERGNVKAMANAWLIWAKETGISW